MRRAELDSIVMFVTTIDDVSSVVSIKVTFADNITFLWSIACIGNYILTRASLRVKIIDLNNSKI